MGVDDRRVLVRDGESRDEARRHAGRHRENQAVRSAERDLAALEEQFDGAPVGKLDAAQPRAEPDLGALSPQQCQGGVDKAFG